MSDSAAQADKKRRVSRACDYCHQRSKRCRASRNGPRCHNCAAFNQPCTFDRPQKRRGAPPRRLKDGSQISPPRRQIQSVHPDPGSVGDAGLPGGLRETEPHAGSEHPTTSLTENVRASGNSWQAPRVTTHATIMDLVELYFEIVYPIFPLFHQPSFTRRISRAAYNSDRSLFCTTMAVCALVSARVRDGAVFNPQWDVHALQEPTPEVYYTEAIRQMDRSCRRSDLNALRAHAILALAAIQDGKIRDMHQRLGRYHTIVAMEGLHDEGNWPKGIGVVETEERRRLFWSIYTLDVFTSIVWGGVIRSREYQSNVAYPTEADDDMFDDTGFASTPFSLASMNTSPVRGESNAHNISWMAGRNFVIDLYRVIEHVMMRFSARRARAQRPIFIDEVLQAETSLSHEAVRNNVMQMYAHLPHCLKETNPITSKPRLDRFGFQAADIIATVQLLRMVLLSAAGASVSERCEIANEVVSAFITIPTAYHCAISVPLLFHLGVIGQILASTLEQPLSEDDYRSIRDVMIPMVQLLSTLEGLHASKGASQRLRDQIARMDVFMASQRRSTRAQQGHPAPVNSTAQLPQEPMHETPYSALGSTAIDETLALSPFQMPPELLGDFSQIFDFSQLS